MTPRTALPTSGRRVLLLEGIHDSAAARFRSAGYQVSAEKRSLSEGELIDRLGGVTVLGIRSKTELTRAVIESAGELAAVGAFCIGTNQIDLGACLERGVAAFNAPFANTRSVVEMALGEIIVLLRSLFEKSRKLHEGRWEKRDAEAREIRGKRLGIIGYGNIGAQLSILAESMGMKVWYYDVHEKLALGNARPARSLLELLRRCDVVSIHVDGSPANRGLIGAAEFASMKEGAVLLNLSRGSVVDLEALRDAVLSGRIRGAAIDVFPEEPRADGSAFDSPLRGLPNVILTPHIGGSTAEAQGNIAAFVPEKLIDFLARGNTGLSVNFPDLQLPATRSSHRVAHVHRNVPGILARINQVMAKRKINITGQYLTTNDRIGYVITDIGQNCDDAVARELMAIPDTIRVRVLY